MRSSMIKNSEERLERMINFYENNSFVILDIETTGLLYKNAEIIEIAAKDLKSDEEFKVYIKGVIVPNNITALTGITQDKINTDGIDIKEALNGLVEFIGSSYVVAQNGVRFDIPFLTYHCLKNGIDFNVKIIDTMLVSKSQFPFEKSHSLKTLCERYNVDYDKNSHHEAMYDVKITEEVFKKQLIKSPIITSEECIDEFTLNFINLFNVKKFDIIYEHHRQAVIDFLEGETHE